MDKLDGVTWGWRRQQRKGERTEEQKIAWQEEFGGGQGASLCPVGTCPFCFYSTPPTPPHTHTSMPSKFLCKIMFFQLCCSMWSKVKLRKENIWKKIDLERTHSFQEFVIAVNLWKTSMESKQDGSIILPDSLEMAQFQTLGWLWVLGFLAKTSRRVMPSL